jgi:hypothetical protein
VIVVNTTTTIAPISLADEVVASIVAKSDLISGVLAAPAIGGLLPSSLLFHISFNYANLFSLKKHESAFYFLAFPWSLALCEWLGWELPQKRRGNSHPSNSHSNHGLGLQPLAKLIVDIKHRKNHGKLFFGFFILRLLGQHFFGLETCEFSLMLISVCYLLFLPRTSAGFVDDALIVLAGVTNDSLKL